MKKVAGALSLAVIVGAAVFFLVSSLNRALDSSPTAESSDTASQVGKSTATTAAVATEVKTPTAPSANDGSQDFAKKLETTQAILPTLDKIHALPAEQKHRTPVPVLQAGLSLGDIATDIEKNPQLAPQGIAFYNQCAKRNDLSTAVRATCLSKLRDLSKETNTPLDEKEISPQIVQLVDKMKAE